MKLKSTIDIANCAFVKMHQFDNADEVPIFETNTVQGLNQIIGYAKFINQGKGTVYYRGENNLHSTLIPSLYRNIGLDTKKASTRLQNMKKIVISNKELSACLKLTGNSNDSFIIEGMLQHYGAKTGFLDLVDNHWIALWMGLHEFVGVDGYCYYKKRQLSDSGFSDSDYLYLLLVAIPLFSNDYNGVYNSSDYVVVDLRKALPSIFLRPHAQHALIAKKKFKDDKQTAEQKDMASQVVGIVKIRIDLASQWLGNGTLVTQQNLFPNPIFDLGYKLLLKYNEELSIVKYV